MTSQHSVEHQGAIKRRFQTTQLSMCVTRSSLWDLGIRSASPARIHKLFQAIEDYIEQCYVRYQTFGGT